MKSLPQFVEDMKATAELLREQADQLDELVRFFGGVTQPRPISPPAHVAAPPPRIAEPASPPPVVHVNGAAPSDTQPPPVKKARKLPERGRMMTKQEKRDIEEDWNSFPPELRTKVNRAALAAKYNCKPLQVYAITRDKVALRENFKGSKQGAKSPQSTSSPHQSERRSSSHGVQ